MDTDFELTVAFRGEVAGMAEHRLSLDAFSQPLKNFLTAFRHSADAVARDRIIKKERPQVGKLARSSDLQLDLGIPSSGSLNLRFLCVFNAEQVDPIIPRRTVSRFLDAIESEGRGGTIASRSVRRYLDSLPSFVHEQSYTGRANNSFFRNVHLSTSDAVQRPRKFPKVIEIKGRVVAIGLDAEHETVRIRQTNGSTFTCPCDREMVEAAWGLRSEAIAAKVLMAESVKRLISIRLLGTQEPSMSVEEKRRYLLDKWDDLLRRLAN